MWKCRFRGRSARSKPIHDAKSQEHPYKERKPFVGIRFASGIFATPASSRNEERGELFRKLLRNLFHLVLFLALAAFDSRDRWLWDLRHHRFGWGHILSFSSRCPFSSSLLLRTSRRFGLRITRSVNAQRSGQVGDRRGCGRLFRAFLRHGLVLLHQRGRRSTSTHELVRRIQNQDLAFFNDLQVMLGRRAAHEPPAALILEAW
eukprot:scaffold1850_cov194-Pinguiococcus_pyrenoidosus.AAC.51